MLGLQGDADLLALSVLHEALEANEDDDVVADHAPGREARREGLCAARDERTAPGAARGGSSMETLIPPVERMRRCPVACIAATCCLSAASVANEMAPFFFVRRGAERPARPGPR